MNNGTFVIYKNNVLLRTGTLTAIEKNYMASQIYEGMLNPIPESEPVGAKYRISAKLGDQIKLYIGNLRGFNNLTRDNITKLVVKIG